jgi:hypothetical protein
MDVLRWWVKTVPAWFWHHATHIKLGDIGGTWIGWIVTAAIWLGEAVLFAGYALLTLGVLAGIAKALQFTGRKFTEGYRKGTAD